MNKKQEEMGENIDNLKVVIMIFDIVLIMLIGRNDGNMYILCKFIITKVLFYEGC